MADSINVPSGMGGLVNYHEEYQTRFMLKPAHVIAFAIAVMVFVIVMKTFWPVTIAA